MPPFFLLDYMKQTTFEAQAFLEAVQFFRQEKGHYGSWEMITGDEVQVMWAPSAGPSVCVIGGQGHLTHDPQKTAQIEVVVPKTLPSVI